jgi:hypothetical protein
MGVNHGWTNPPRIGSGRTLIQVVPKIFVIFQNFKRSPWILPPQIYATALIGSRWCALQHVSVGSFQVNLLTKMSNCRTE